MGYTTKFTGKVQIKPWLNDDEASFLAAFNDTRRMRRSKGPLYVNGSGWGNDADVQNRNDPPDGQPSLWCDWATDGRTLYWDGAEKAYEMERWLAYLIDHLLGPKARAFVDSHAGEDARLTRFTCDHVLNGEVEATGEDPDDRWKIVVTDNRVSVVRAVAVTWGAPKRIN